MTDEQFFYEERLTGLGSSDMGDLFELPPYGCKKRLWFVKRGVEPDFPPPRSLQQAARRGKKLEPIIGEEYAEATGRAVERQDKMIRHPQYDFLIAHLDFITIDPDRFWEERALEVKCPGWGVFRQVNKNGLLFPWICQSQQQQFVGKEHGIFGAAFAVMHLDTWTLIKFDVDPDEDLQALILEEATKFWPTVENGPQPEGFPPSEPRCRSCGFRYRCHGDAILAVEEPKEEHHYISAPEYRDLIEEVLECQEIEDEAHALTEQAKRALGEAVGWPKKIKVPGGAVNTYSYTREDWDSKALNQYLEKSGPGVQKMFEKYRRKTPVNAMRVFRI